MRPVEPPHAPGRTVAVGLARAVGATVAVVAGYFLLPLDWVADVPPALSVPIAALAFAALLALQVRAIVGHRYPGVRAVEALATSVPLFLVFFAAVYYSMAVADPAWFSQPLGKLDALYFTVTVFATVGFGDITAVSQEARAVVTLQMVLNLLVIGVGIRIILGAVQQARQRRAGGDDGS